MHACAWQTFNFNLCNQCPKTDHARLIIAMLTLHSFISGICIKHTLYTHGTWSDERLPDLLAFFSSNERYLYLYETGFAKKDLIYMHLIFLNLRMCNLTYVWSTASWNLVARPSKIDRKFP